MTDAQDWIDWVNMRSERQRKCRKKGHPGEVVISEFQSGLSQYRCCNCTSCGEKYVRRETTSEAITSGYRASL